MDFLYRQAHQFSGVVLKYLLFVLSADIHLFYRTYGLAVISDPVLGITQREIDPEQDMVGAKKRPAANKRS